MAASYCFRSRRLAGRALMMRILSPRSVWTTTSNFPSWERPKIMNRFSLCECAGSGIVTERGSPKTVAAASKLTLCLARFDCALFASHSKVNTPEIQTPFAPFVHPKLLLSAAAGHDLAAIALTGAAARAAIYSAHVYHRHRHGHAAAPLQPAGMLDDAHQTRAVPGMHSPLEGHFEKSADGSERHRHAPPGARPSQSSLRDHAGCVARTIH